MEMKKIYFFFYLRDILKSWIQFALISKASLKEITDTVYISLEVGFCIYMLCRNHLWKVDDNRLAIIFDHYVKFIKISMNNTMIRQSDNQIHELVVQCFHVVYFIYVTPKIIQSKHYT